ncbi:outer membrane beta-barrel family protein [Avrilella dinanensis]|uniref:TonB-dependent receptor n=1 Tax=Avrilella dinanensis TaxID=2008672 RepID=A0A2M9R6Q3_9FLAO|nr:outer membrane beta-barrel family protein [Avrilella dinanensis]PJR04530.1 TonB-dependent receptor [Avrilella dinanensis]
MKNFKSLFLLFALFSMSEMMSQNQLVISGKIIDKDTKQPLEYASVIFQSNTDVNYITGEITDENGDFTFEVNADVYEIKVEYMGFDAMTIPERTVNTDWNMGTVEVSAGDEQLEDLVIEVERSPVEIKLDKRIYNVGDDNVVKGGTASDVLDNIPSVSVDSDGTVSLRGNESVRVLIDGKPSGMASNIADALKMLSAESIEQVEVITNPSARYEAEGGAGLINIILKKGKNQGVNGNVTATVSNPFGYSVASTLNYREENFNIFANLSYRDNKTLGNSVNNSEYFDENGNTSQFVDEYSNRERMRRGFNGNIGFEWYLTDKLTWNNNFSWRRSHGDNPNEVIYHTFDAQRNPDNSRVRNTAEDDMKENVDYTSEFTFKFNDEGHQLLASATVFKNYDIEDSNIRTYMLGTDNSLSEDITKAQEADLNHQLRLDYTLPINDNTHFEAGYLGTFNKLDTDYEVNSYNNGVLEPNELFLNNLEYKENIQALYTQFGSKINRFSYMLGLRWESSKINVNQFVTNDFNEKKYNNFFPSVFLNYEFNESTNASISYSKRVRRPRGRMLNPISDYSSSISFFMGNPDLNPAFTDAFDVGFMKRWNYFTLSTSAYLNRTTDSFEYVRRINGVNDEGIPITVMSPINLSDEYRYGMEFNFNYTPYHWLKLNGNLNLFQQQTRGDYTFTDFDGNEVYQNFDQDAFRWTGRLTARVNLPVDIDWQTNYMYFSGGNNSQGKMLDNHNINMSLSKDFLNDRATLSFNVQDLLNSRKWRNETYLETANIYREMQWRERTFNLSFTYRFNQSKKEAQQRNNQMSNDDGEVEMM